MDDPVLRAYLKDFCKSYDLSDSDKNAFEFFAAYCVYLRDFSEHVLLDDVVVGGGLDSGIDAIAVFLNDISVTSSAQVDDIATRQKMDVDFCFVQAKTSSRLLKK